MFRYILQKPKEDRNLFDIRWLHKELSTNNFFKKLIDQGDYDISHQWFKELGYVWAQPGETIIKYMDIGDTFYIIVKGMVDVFVPSETTVNLTNIEFAKLLSEYNDMLLEINDDSKIPEPNPQYWDNESFNKISIKDLVARMDGNFSAAVTISSNTPRSKRGSRASLINDTENSKTSPDVSVKQNCNFRLSQKEKVWDELQ